jgi:hypothetical protein
MNRQVRIAGIALAAASLLATGAHAAAITGLFDTGVDAGGTPLAEGATDTHWVLNGAASPVVYDHPSYLLTSDARFIAQAADGSYTSNPNTYTLTFDLTGLNAATAQLSGNFEADNFASVFLNGNLLAQDLQGTFFSNFQSLTPFSSGAGNFVAGLNTLSFVVTDTGPPSAFLVSGLAGTADVGGGVPEPASWGLMLVGFGGLGAALRRRRGSAVATA